MSYCHLNAHKYLDYHGKLNIIFTTLLFASYHNEMSKWCQEIICSWKYIFPATLIHVVVMKLSKNCSTIPCFRNISGLHTT